MMYVRLTTSEGVFMQAKESNDPLIRGSFYKESGQFFACSQGGAILSPPVFITRIALERHLDLPAGIAPEDLGTVLMTYALAPVDQPVRLIPEWALVLAEMGREILKAPNGVQSGELESIAHFVALVK